MTALREAAQQALEALGLAKLNGKAGLYPAEIEEIADAIAALRAALAQQDEPVEPVAWRSENANPPGGHVIFQQYPQALADLGKPIQPLYTAPPQRKLVPLTEEEIMHIGMTHQSLRQVVRAVERAHGIKE